MRYAFLGERLELVYQRLFTIRDLRRDRQSKNSNRNRPAQIVEKLGADIVKPSAMSRRDIDELKHAEDIAMRTGVNIIALQDCK